MSSPVLRLSGKSWHIVHRSVTACDRTSEQRRAEPASLSNSGMSNRSRVMSPAAFFIRQKQLLAGCRRLIVHDGGMAATCTLSVVIMAQALALEPHMSPTDVARALRAQSSAPTVAIIGGGLAGLSTAYHLSTGSRPAIAVFDAAPPGSGGASAASAGLLHPLTTRAGLIWRGERSFESASALVRSTERRAQQRARESGGAAPSLCATTGIVRTARSSQQVETFTSAMRAFEGTALDVSWVDTPRVANLLGAQMVPSECAGAVWFPAGLCVDTPAYLRALWASVCEDAPVAAWCLAHVSSLDEYVDAFDHVVVAAGAASAAIAGLEDLPFALWRGQALVWEGVPAEARPAAGVLCGSYVVPLADGRVIGGATQERVSASTCTEDADERSAAALAELRAELQELWPGMARAGSPAARTTGVRAVPRRLHLGTVPLCGRVELPRTATPTSAEQPRSDDALRPCWFLTGLGSRGLLYHAELGCTVARALERDDEGELIPETRRWPKRDDVPPSARGRGGATNPLPPR